MSTLAAVVGAVLAFAAAALSAKWMIPKLCRKGYLKTPVEKKGEDFVPGHTAPALGGLPMAVGMSAGVITGFLILLFDSSSGMTDYARLWSGLLLALMLAASGLLDDFRQCRGLEPLSRPVLLILQCAAGFCCLTTLILCGDRSTILAVPFAGQADLNWLYHPLCLLLIIGAASGGEKTAETDGTAATVSMISGLSIAFAGGLTGSGPAAVLGCSLAGCALGLLLYSFPPAKLRCGKGGGMFFGGAAAAAALGCGMPALLLTACLPWVLEGIFALVRLGYYAFFGKTMQAESFGRWLEEKGLSEKTVSGISMGVSLAGFVLTAAAAFRL